MADFLKRSRLTQNSFGASIGVSQSQVFQWLSDRRPIPMEHAIAIQDRYGLDAEQLCLRLAKLRQAERRLRSLQSIPYETIR